MVRSSMRMIVVSDIHFELGSHHGVDESGAFKWLLKKVEHFQPDALVGLGDWGTAWTKPQWNELTDMCKVTAIYGNHEKLELLRSLRDSNGGPTLAQDGELREIGGLRFGFINGIVSETKRVKQGVPRKSPEEYVEIGSELHGVDVLCTHESPLNIERTGGTPEYGKGIHESPGTKAVEEVIRTVRPKLVLSGHLSGPYTLGKFGDATCLRVDSSPAEKYFAMLDTLEGLLYIRHDWEAVSVVDGIFP